MNHIKQQWQIFWHSLMFFTRIPVPKHIVYSEAYMHNSTAYLPLTGIIVGLFGALFFWLGNTYVDTTIAAIISTVATVWLTGAFHEDGFADLCDGFGGGYTKEKILLIMKDSRSGAYAVVGVALILMLKIAALSKLGALSVIALPAGHALSRVPPIIIGYFYKYARIEDSSSKSKSTAKKLGKGYMLLALLSGMVPLVLFDNMLYWIAVPIALAVAFLLGEWFKRRIGGYAGDCLGASQQITEVIVYLSWIICSNHLSEKITFIDKLNELF